MSSLDGTEDTERSWHFVMHAQNPLTADQCDIMDQLDGFADGMVSREERPGVFTNFVCYFVADSLMDAMKDALARVGEIPGVQISSIELNSHSFEHNGMATPAVVRPPA
ncbi:hypothetical protein [Streptomyces sp. NPDC051567]|uniref:hypothetical protein n=1 Tax=Streptomyces sp. NPDC051567 TaxID=3365660 RepID=UPI0037AB782C